jgi:hypothetical protein
MSEAGNVGQVADGCRKALHSEVGPVKAGTVWIGKARCVAELARCGRQFLARQIVARLGLLR